MNKVVLVGCGYWGKNWYNTLTKRDNVEIVAVIDPKPSIPVNNQYNNLTEFVNANLEYNKVIIAVQAEYHKLYYDHFLNKPLRRTTDILIEKPCGLPEDKDDLIGCFPGYIFLSSPQYKVIKEMVNKRMLGDLMYGTFKRASMGPRLRTYVSIIEDYAIHDLYLYQSLFEPKSIEKIYKSLSQSFKTPIKEDTLFLTIEADNHTASFFSSWRCPIKTRKIIIVGTKGSIFWENDKRMMIR
jgi:predicted dehydrogenase